MLSQSSGLAVHHPDLYAANACFPSCCFIITQLLTIGAILQETQSKEGAEGTKDGLEQELRYKRGRDRHRCCAIIIKKQALSGPSGSHL